jgi:polyphosphate kinase
MHATRKERTGPREPQPAEVDRELETGRPREGAAGAAGVSPRARRRRSDMGAAIHRRGFKRVRPETATRALPPQAGAPIPFLNRELSWLEFNARVLHEACDPRTPLLERLRFLGIFSSNLDEFFMKRVGGLKRQLVAGVARLSLDGLSAAQQMAAVRAKVQSLVACQTACYLKDVKPRLAEQGILLLQWEELAEPERQVAKEFFHKRIFPVLTPLAVDSAHPFPFISNLSTSLGVILRAPGGEESMFARIKIPRTLPAWIRIETPDSKARHRFVSLLDAIRDNLASLFPDMEVADVMPFRITRNADIEREEEDAEDLLQMMEQEVRQRRFEKVVRLEHAPNPNPEMLRFLMQELDLTDDDLYETAGELDYTGLGAVADLPLPALRYPAWTPAPHPALAHDSRDIFAILRSGDLLVHHPFEDFTTSVEHFVQTAAEDPRVLAIKMIIYRTGDNSPMIRTLIRAAEDGKQVVCLVELKARFDEERNIYWAQVMEQAGIHVVYGLVGLKTHGKICLVIRDEGEDLRCYAHIGTGNYNVQTARLYTDLGLFTCRREVTDELIQFFNYLTGRSLNRQYRKLLVAPINMRERFLEMIARETAHARAGKPAHILAKMNSLEEDGIIRALYEASQAGVRVDLIVRGFCCLKPGVPGISDNIRVLSVIGRFLEHSRLFYFRNGAPDPVDGEFFIGSADWMYRNLLARVEVVTPIEDRVLREKCWEIATLLLQDQRQAWDLTADGTYVQRHPDPPDAPGVHARLMDLTRQRAIPV